VFERVEQTETIRCRYCKPDEDDLPVCICRDLRVPLEEAWPRFIHYT
jgi:hypothetical protein